MKTKKSSFSLPQDLWLRIRVAAAQQDVSVSQWIRRILEAELNRTTTIP